MTRAEKQREYVEQQRGRGMRRLSIWVSDSEYARLLAEYPAGRGANPTTVSWGAVIRAALEVPRG